MQIILQEDVDKLGNRGQVVDVADGYARNYLLPRKLALTATPSNLKQLGRMRATFAKREATETESAQQLAEVLAGVSVTLSRKAGENDQLFGSVTASDISDALAAQSVTIDKKKIQLDTPIKLVGEYQVPVKIFREVGATIKVTVQREA